MNASLWLNESARWMVSEHGSARPSGIELPDSAREADREACARIPRQAARARLSAMEFGDQPDYVKSEPEMRPVVGLRGARLPQGLEQALTGRGRERRAWVIDLYRGVMRLQAHPQGDRRTRRAEIHRVIHELVEHLHDQIRRPLDRDRMLW